MHCTVRPKNHASWFEEGAQLASVQTAITAHYSSKQLLLFAFADQYSATIVSSDQ